VALSGTPMTDANPTVFHLADQLLGRPSVIGVCHDIDRRKSVKSGLIVESHQFISADAFGGVQLFLSNAGNHDRSLVFCRAHGRAANAADDARNQRHLRFLGGRRALVVLRGEIKHKDLWWIDLDTGAEHQLTNLAPDFEVQDFDISPDGREVVLQRAQVHSEIVLLDLPRR